MASYQTPGLFPAEKKEWDRSDGMLSGFVYGWVSDEYQYLIEDCKTGTAAWATLKAHFEKSTIGYCMAACAKFYKIHHDPDHPISTYLQALQSAKQKLSAFGVNIDNTKFKDSPKLDLAKIKVMLTSSTATDPVTIESERASAA
ncbi:hypothetical protein C0989_005130 [Termitomyces sp. Mn162]|nr:hypothetical protein C0989_005130 [Termitomyces sp. Mn162]